MTARRGGGGGEWVLQQSSSSKYPVWQAVVINVVLC